MKLEILLEKSFVGHTVIYHQIKLEDKINTVEPV